MNRIERQQDLSNDFIQVSLTLNGSFLSCVPTVFRDVGEALEFAVVGCCLRTLNITLNMLTVRKCGMVWVWWTSE